MKRQTRPGSAGGALAALAATAALLPGPAQARQPTTPTPTVFSPIDSSAHLPANTSRSAHETFWPYFCLIGQSSRRALSRFALSGQLLSGAKRCWPSPPPPRPSAIRYVPAACHVMRMKRGP